MDEYEKIIESVIFVVSGCTSSAYNSGWNLKETTKIFHECAQASFAPGFYFPENADRLVTMNLLSNAEAEKVKKHKIFVGDRECAAYAAYGFKPSEEKFSSNPK